MKANTITKVYVAYNYDFINLAIIVNGCKFQLIKDNQKSYATLKKK